MGVKKIAIIIFILLIAISFVIFLLSKDKDKIETPTEQPHISDQNNSTKIGSNNNSSNINNNNSLQVQSKHGILLNRVPEPEKEIELEFQIISGKVYLDGSKIKYVLSLETEYEDTVYKCDIEVVKKEYDDALNKGKIKAYIAIIRAGGKVFLAFV